MTAAPRRRLIRQLLGEHVVASQEQMVTLLAERGHQVTQATVSRDLEAIGAVKISEPRGPRYIIRTTTRELPDLARVIDRFVIAIVPSGNLVVLTTDPGGAHLVGGAIDRADLDGVVGTVAGDDTVIVIADEQVGGTQLSKVFEEMAPR